MSSQVILDCHKKVEVFAFIEIFTHDIFFFWFRFGYLLWIADRSTVDDHTMNDDANDVKSSGVTRDLTWPFFGVGVALLSSL